MKIVRVRITGKANGQGYLASVTMDLEFPGGFLFQFRGMRLIENKSKKVVLAMPNVKDRDGNWKDVVSTLNDMTQLALEKAAIDAWMKNWPSEEGSLKDMLEPL